MSHLQLLLVTEMLKVWATAMLKPVVAQAQGGLGLSAQEGK